MPSRFGRREYAQGECSPEESFLELIFGGSYRREYVQGKYAQGECSKREYSLPIILVELTWGTPPASTPSARTPHSSSTKFP